MKILVTGGCGFIGSNFIRYWLGKHPEDNVYNLDKLTYAGNPENLRDVEKDFPERYEYAGGDICDSQAVNNAFERFEPEAVVNFAAESHNSNAVANPGVFFRTNVLGTQTLLEAVRLNGNPRFHHISTCEVYGQMALDSTGSFAEDSPYKPRTPYNASKAGADLAVRAYVETFHVPATVSVCCNNYGAFQFPEKLIPLFVTNLMDGKPVSVYKNSQNRREWLHVLDHCRAIELILEKGKLGGTYNVGSGIEKSVEEVTTIILKALGKPESMKSYVDDRPGHDTRYLLDSSKIRRKLGWSPQTDFDDGIAGTIEWYVNNRKWWEPLKKRLVVQETGWKSPDKK